MAYANKYYITFPNLHFGTSWTIYIEIDGFSGDLIPLVGSGEPCFINFEQSSENIFSPIRASSLEFEAVESTDDSLLELFSKDRFGKVKVYKGSDLFWVGWTIVDDYNSLYNVPPKKIKFTAIDGISYLKDRKLFDTGCSIFVNKTDRGNRYLLEYFKECFDYIGLSIGLRESLDLYIDNWAKTDRLLEIYYVNTVNFLENETEYVTLYEVLEKVLMSFGARLYQKDGLWYIDRIRQLLGDTINYHGYTSALVYSTDYEETLTKAITSKSGSPLNVPINHSLYKSFDKIYKKLTNRVDYKLNKNLIKNYDQYVVRGLSYELNDSMLKIEPEGEERGDPQYHCVRYNLGRAYINFLTYSEIEIIINGKLLGSVDLQLFYDIGSKTYCYNQDTRFWEEFDGEITAHSLRIDNYTEEGLVYTKANFSESYTTSTLGFDLVSRTWGDLYLRILSPIIDDAHSDDIDWDDAYFEFDVKNIEINYLEATLTNGDLNQSQETWKGELAEINQVFYSNPMYQLYISSLEEFDHLPYWNPQLYYPGLVYYKDGDDEFIPITYFNRADETEGKPLELIVLEDYMYFYANRRLVLNGTLLGEINIGNVLTYAGRKYLIDRCIMNLKMAFNDINLIELEGSGEFLLLETGDYLLLEDGNKVIL